MPKKNGRPASVWLAVGLLLAAIAFAALIGTLGFFATRLVVPDAPVWVSLLFALLGLIVALRYIAARFEWIMPWYYLLPAILFLLSFTVFPVVLTIILAFSDYAGIRNGELNVSTETAITNISGTSIDIESAQNLGCERLYNGCNNVRAVVYASGLFEVTGLSAEDNVITVDPAPPEGRTVTTAEFFLPSVGSSFQFPVTEVRGNELILERAPPPAAELETIRLRLDRDQFATRIVSIDSNTLTLASPLPEGRAYEAIARYNEFSLVGLDNFRAILAQANRALWPVFAWNISFAVLTIVINTIFGVLLAVLLNNPNLQFRNLYRTLLIVSWALPNIITIQVWRGFLNTNFGAINRFLALLDLPTFDWLGDPVAAKAAILVVNLWLGLPFMMTATLGALSAIPSDVYEAAKIDGATPWQAFWNVTAPLLRIALVPIALTGFAFNFNNFNIVFLLTDGGPPTSWGTATARGTDILISWAYNEAFRAQGGFAYGLGSAISILIFFITIAVSLINFRVTGALKEERSS